MKSKIYNAVQSKYFVPGCFILAILLRVIWIILVQSIPVSDSNWYFTKGIELAAGKGYTINGTPTAYYPAGYPMFLAVLFKLFGDSLLLAKLTNVILYIGIMYFSYGIGKKIFNSESVGRITLFILTVYPNHIAYSSILATEILFLFLLLCGAYLLLISNNRIWMLVIAGIIWGMMCMVRPQGFFIPLILIFTSFVLSKSTFMNKVKSLLFIYVFIILLMLPWIIRNNNVFHEFFIISTNDGINLVIGNNPYASGEYTLDSNIISYIPQDNFVSADSLKRDLNSDYWTKYGFADENIANKKLRSKAIDYIVHNPVQTIKLMPMKLWLNYKKGNEGIGWSITGLQISTKYKNTCLNIFKGIANYVYYLVMIFALVYIAGSIYKNLFKKQQVLFPSAGLWIMIYFSLLALVYFGGYRFHFPSIPWLVMYCSAFLESVIKPKD